MGSISATCFGATFKKRVLTAAIRFSTHSAKTMPHSLSSETSSSPIPDKVPTGDDHDSSQETSQGNVDSHSTVQRTDVVDASSPLPAVKDLKVDDDLLDDVDDDDDEHGEWPDSTPQDDYNKDIPSDAPP